MEMREAYRRQLKRGDRPCTHPNVEREYYLGSHTGDSVCTVCGAAVEPDKLDHAHCRECHAPYSKGSER
jgi:hypothetical protein